MNLARKLRTHLERELLAHVIAINLGPKGVDRLIEGRKERMGEKFTKRELASFAQHAGLLVA